jgi:fumarate reductase subunit D
MCICSVLLLFITVLLPTGSLPLRAIALILFVESKMKTMALPTLLYGIAQVLHLYNKVGNAKVKMYNTLALSTLLYGCETWSVGERIKPG